MSQADYIRRTGEIEHYFDRTALDAWKRLTGDQPVSGIRATVRKGREEMRGTQRRSPLVSSEPSVNTPAELDRRIQRRLAEHGATVGAGGYDEARLIYDWPLGTLPLGLNLSNQANGSRTIIGTMVFKSEPYA